VGTEGLHPWAFLDIPRLWSPMPAYIHVTPPLAAGLIAIFGASNH